MSSNDSEEDFNDSEHLQSNRSKKRRVHRARACDVCRRKKGDSGAMPGNPCSYCIANRLECTYVEAAVVKKRGPPRGYVERLEKVLTRLLPGSDIKELEAAIDIDVWLVDKIPHPPSNLEASVTPSDTPQRHPRDTATNFATTFVRKCSTEQTGYPQDDDVAHILLATDFKDFHIEAENKAQFFGKSSAEMLIHTAMELKNEYTGANRRPILGSRREEFWIPCPWESSPSQVQKAKFVFPDDDLVESLLDLYFEKFNLFFPLLHHPSFKRSVAEDVHLHDDGFGANLLLVCAVASRFSDDPRVLMDGVRSSHSGGWKWFHQAHQMRRSVLAPPSLYELQFYCLSVMFLQGASVPHSSWTMVGIGIRLAQDVGAHRRKLNKDNMTMEDELWKRAFWVLVTMDRMASAALGRPCAIQGEDFDVDFLIECDDEYWEHPDPAKRFKQPPNRPSYITGFNVLLKLNHVMALMMRTIYSINKPRATLGLVGQEWNQQVVAELDSVLNKWVDSVPDHLRWDPTRKNIKFFQQSAWLYCTYYYTQILLHRSFIPSPHKSSPLSFPSLAICTNAARSCSHIAEIYHRRDLVAPPVIQMSIFTAGTVLLLNIWAGKRSGLSIDPSKEMVVVQKCMHALRKCEVRWPSAGRLWDILYELASVGEVSLPSANTLLSNKHNRDSDSPVSSSTHSATPSSLTSADAPRTIAGSRRVTRDVHTLGMQPAAPNIEPQLNLEPQVPFTLPPYSNGLSRFPVSPQLQFGAVTASMLGQGQIWDAVDLPTGAASTTRYGQSGPPNAPLPLNMDLFTQMGFGLGSPFAQPSSASGTLQSSHGSESLWMGSAAAMILDQRSPDMMTQEFAGMNPNLQALMDSDTVAMWSNAPSGFELDDWGAYLRNVSELTHGMYHPPAGG